MHRQKARCDEDPACLIERRNVGQDHGDAQRRDCATYQDPGAKDREIQPYRLRLDHPARKYSRDRAEQWRDNDHRERKVLADLGEICPAELELASEEHGRQQQVARPTRRNDRQEISSGSRRLF